MLFTFEIIINRKEIKEIKYLLWVIAISIFYLVYSFVINSNVPKAIIMDYIIEIKPYIGFFCALLLKPKLSKEQKLFITILCIVFSLYLLIVGVLSQIDVFFKIEETYGSSVVITAMLYLYCSSFTWRDFLFFLLIFSIGLISTRSKFYGLFIFAILFGVVIKSGYKFKISFGSIILVILTLVLIIAAAWGKIYYYFVFGTEATNMDYWGARPALYVVSPLILIDYFPFGSGYASFATYPSSLFYSDIYQIYHINKIWGLSKEHPEYICDAFYPSLVQFGFVGIIIHILFWRFLYKISALYKKYICADKLFYLSIVIICFFAIHGTSATTFTNSRGFVALVLAGIILAEMKTKVEAVKLINKDEDINNSL